MSDFIVAYNRWRCVIFSILSSMMVLAGVLVFHSDPLSSGALAGALSCMGIFALYFFLGRCSHVPQRTRYLIRVVPVLFLVALIAGLLLAGFIVYIVHASDPLRMTSTTTLEELPRTFILVFIILGLLLPIFVILSARDVVLALRAHHHVGQQSIRFFTRKKEWTVRPSEYVALVLGEQVVFACKKEDDLMQAVEYVNRPLEQSWLARPLDGVHYINTEALATDLGRRGFTLQKERRAIIARFSLS